jgi:hypothetical protein
MKEESGMATQIHGARSGMRKAALVAAATALIAAALPAAAVASTPPPTLSTEFLSAYPIPLYEAGSSLDVVASCNPTGTSTIAWSAAGNAYGPYPGTFVETGTATVGPQDGSADYVNGIPLGQVLSIDAFFTIDSSVGQVSGSKRLTTSAGSMGGCAELVDFLPPGSGTPVNGEFRRVFSNNMTYDALVDAGGALYLDTGTVGTLLERFLGTGMAEINVVQEALSNSTQVPASAKGRATGGGHVGGVAFGFNALSDKSGPKGRCAVVDADADVMVKCLDVTKMVVATNRAYVYGNALFNGSAVTYRIDVTDNGEPGIGVDRWSIQLSNGWTAGGTLSEGNVQVSA